MLKDIAKVRLQGSNFTNATELALLCQDGTPVKASLIYGRNGSGKSTIARAIKKLKGDDIPTIQSISLVDIYNAATTISNVEKAHIFVFDEDYVTANVRIQEDGLGSIVMLGEQAGLTEQIEIATRELQTAEADRDNTKQILDEYNNAVNINSPRYYINQMRLILQRDEGWAGRKRQIDELRRNPSVNDETYRQFITLTPEKSRDDLLIEYRDKWQELQNVRNGTARIDASVPSIPQCYTQYQTEETNALLHRHIEHPELNEREQYLMGLVQRGMEGELRATANEFSNPVIIRCPKCHQELTQEYKMELIESIQKVLSREVEEYQYGIAQKKLQSLELDLTSFSGLTSYQTCIDQINELCRIISTNNGLLESKRVNPYIDVTEDLINISEAVQSVDRSLRQLESERLQHNRAVTDTRPIKAELTRINNEIAHYDVIEFSRTYDAKKEEQASAQLVYNAAMAVVDEKRRTLNGLNSRRDSIDIAPDIINERIKYVFFSENRMQIVVEENTYRLYSNGHHVKPTDVSVGERNIIGLCYFFTSILRGKNRETAYGEEYLLIIDDPVSSYDLENKVGILSYLKYELGKFLLGNIETRAVVMTHDLLTALDFEKAFKELMKACTRKFNGQRGFTYAPLELTDRNVIRFANGRNEYTELIKVIFEYGNGGAVQQEAYIGNIMRQVLEAFSTFEFKEKIDEVSTDDSVLELIETEADREYFKNLMYRIVLNEGSHRYDQVRNMHVDFFAFISETEKRRTAKEILCFMFLLNKPHMKAHLGEQNCTVIESWCEDIRNRTVTAP